MSLAKIVAPVLIMGGAVVLHGQAAGESAGPVLKYIETSKPELLNPIDGMRNVIGVRVVELVFRGLFTQDREGKWVPELAEELPELQPGATEMTVRIRPEAKWPDGRDLTAQDVVFSYEVYMDEENSFGNRSNLEVFERVEALDDKTVRFVLRQSDRDVIPRAGFYLVPKHMLKKTYLDKENSFNRAPIGAGPYEVSDVEDNIIRFAVNANYYKEKPSIGQIELQVNPDENVHQHMLMTGGVYLDPVIRPEDIATIDRNAYTQIEPYDSKTWFGFAYNCRNEFLRFKEVRQALTYLFNREEALDSNFLNQGELVSGPFTQSSFCYNSEVQVYPYDEIAGERFLEDAGMIDSDGDNTKDYNGKPLRLRMVLSKGMSQANKNVCNDFVRQLKSHLIEVDLDWQDENAWYEKIFFDRDYDITFLSWKFDEGSNIYPLFSRSQQLPGLYNIIQFDNEEVEELLGRFRYGSDQSERAEIGKRLHAVLSDECPYTFLWTLTYNAGRRIEVKKINIDPFYFFRGIENWEVE